VTEPAQVRVLHTSIAVPLTEAYDFAHRPENFPQWASGLASGLERRGDEWVGAAPQGEAIVRFSPRNDFGVLDHWVRLPDVPEIYVPLRMLANGDGTEVELVLFRLPGMSDADFEQDACTVKRDLAALKALLERRAG
jgi:hypothetical protein